MTQDEISKLLEQRGDWTPTREILSALGDSRSSVYQCLSRMKKNGKTDRRKITTNSGFYYEWKLSNYEVV